MNNIAVLGAVYGDEGKGHIVHHLAPDYDWVIRFSGGANAGHTIYRDEVKYVHNLLPSFDWRAPRTKAFLGSGMVIDLEQLRIEVANLWGMDKNYASRIYVDPDAFVVLPKHKEEDKATNGHIGSTNRGIGPAYKDKMSRSGTRIRDLLQLLAKNDVGAIPKNLFRPGIDLWELVEMGVRFEGVLELQQQFKYDKLLFEGAQGILLDINHGIYPYVSCGDATVAGIYACGFSKPDLQTVYGVAKCYSTKVGEGPFPTEILGQEAEDLRKLGNEYGATTGRPRRVGWLDLPALKYACNKGGITNLILTKFDILNGQDSVNVCNAYEDGTPTNYKDFFNAKPKYIKARGWQNARDTEQLIPFIQKVERHTERYVNYVSCGTAATDIVSW